MLSPVIPHASESISSVSEEQSVPQPTEASSFKINGLGVALTAKNSRNPGFQENARYRRSAFSRMPFSS